MTGGIPIPCGNTYQCSCGATVCQHTEGHSKCGTE